METKIRVNGFISRVIPATSGIPKMQVQIGFVLNDALKIKGKNRPKMSQYSYEQKIITVDCWQVFNDSHHISQMVNYSLYRDMHMNPDVEAHMAPDSEERVCPRVVKLVKALVEASRRNYAYFDTVSLQFLIETTVKMPDEMPAGTSEGPNGEHSYARFQDRRCYETCGSCRLNFVSPVRIVVTPCHHALHKSCNATLEGSCPVCSFHLGPMDGGQLPFDAHDA